MAALLTEYHLTDPDDMHPAVALARYGKRRTGDLFVGLWLGMIVEAQQMRPSLSNVKRQVEKFESGQDLRRAVEEAGGAAVDAELADAARVYFASALEDASYTSTLLKMRRLSGTQVRDKAAHEVLRTADLILEARLGERYVPLLVRGFLAGLAPHGARELREALADHPELVDTITPILEA
ncbi:DUF6553 family protein [Tessaracoccus sp. MC1756]|uniref:DUF6553 family protein n=1 Tax=Tessaracoccus sp. MC1756 TaxID=2760311 RepID=UPI00160153C7|nr:DUF6553 family protein [Tessaracoccus sp. MC1756]MBB1510308.1 hypothetical protein [Tessaracoccus sp. MC1756]